MYSNYREEGSHAFSEFSWHLKPDRCSPHPSDSIGDHIDIVFSESRTRHEQFNQEFSRRMGRHTPRVIDSGRTSSLAVRHDAGS
jgi:hypothetical protein